jgi:hypothetical protein
MDLNGDINAAEKVNREDIPPYLQNYMKDNANDMLSALQVNLFTFVPFVSSLGDAGVPDGVVFFAWIIALAILASVVFYVWYLVDLFKGKKDSKFAIWASIGTFAIFVVMLIALFVHKLIVNKSSK